jgi:hypothetical protein
MTSLFVALTLAASLAVTPVMDIARGTNETVVFRDGRPVLKYRYDSGAFKPYVSFLATPSGMNLLRDSPPDHAHHHGLMFGISVDGVDFWGEKVAERPGREVPLGPVEGAGRGNILFTTYSVEQSLRWQEAASGENLLLEKRFVECYRLTEDYNCTLITWRSRFNLPPQKNSVTFGGHHYFGLGMRFVESMDGFGEFIYAQPDVKPEVVRGDERLARAQWCALHSVCQGKPVTVAMFDAPTNPRRPATWFTMSKPFTYLSATLNLWKEPCLVTRPGTLSLTYGVAVWDGHASAEVVELTYQKWLLTLPEEVTPAPTNPKP